jgi:hypothetical protein
MTPAEVESTPVSMLTIDEIVEHLYRRDGVRALVVLSEESPDEQFHLRRYGPKSAAIGLLTAAVEMFESEAEASE